MYSTLEVTHSFCSVHDLRLQNHFQSEAASRSHLQRRSIFNCSYSLHKNSIPVQRPEPAVFKLTSEHSPIESITGRAITVRVIIRETRYQLNLGASGRANTAPTPVPLPPEAQRADSLTCRCRSKQLGIQGSKRTDLMPRFQFSDVDGQSLVIAERECNSLLVESSHISIAADISSTQEWGQGA